MTKDNIELIIERLPYIASILEANAHKFPVPDHIPAKARTIREAANALEALTKPSAERVEAARNRLRIHGRLIDYPGGEIGFERDAAIASIADGVNQ